MRWNYLHIYCSTLGGLERKLQIFQSFGTLDQEFFGLFARSEVAQCDLFAVLFLRGGYLVCPPT